jgi:hypothetical protein
MRFPYRALQLFGIASATAMMRLAMIFSSFWELLE